MASHPVVEDMAASSITTAIDETKQSRKRKPLWEECAQIKRTKRKQEAEIEISKIKRKEALAEGKKILKIQPFFTSAVIEHSVSFLHECSTHDQTGTLLIEEQLKL